MEKYDITKEERLSITNPQVYLTSNNGIVLYHINGDRLYSFTKKDCQFRIRQLRKAGYFDMEMQRILFKQLKDLKRP